MPPLEDYGPLTSLLALPDVTEIMVNGPDRIFIEQGGRITAAERRFQNDVELLRVVRQLVTLAGRDFSPQNPMMDCHLRDGSRFTLTLPPVTRQVAFTIRRRGADRLQDLGALVARAALSTEMAEFLRVAVLLQLNLLIAGGTSSGKTTLLTALASAIPRNTRIVTIEDTFEIALPHNNWVPLTTVTNVRREQAVDMRDLVAHALHLRPDRILLGEVRAGEALDMLQAMNSGHEGSMATIHASSAWDALSRLETLVLTAGYELPLIAVRQQISRAIHLIIHMRRNPNGSRQITSISEVAGLENGQVVLKDVFTLLRDSVTGQSHFAPTGYRPSLVPRALAAGLPLPPSLSRP